MEEIIKKYKDAAKKHGEATNDGKYKIANKQYNILTLLYREFENNFEKAKKVLNILLEDDNIYVRSWAAAHALGLNIFLEKAKRILIEISKQTNIGIIRLDVEMTLKEWYKGKLKF